MVFYYASRRMLQPLKGAKRFFWPPADLALEPHLTTPLKHSDQIGTQGVLQRKEYQQLGALYVVEVHSP